MTAGTHHVLPQPTRFIDPVALTRISSLELVARTVVEGFISGLHRSPHLGFSVNFAEYRAYHPGDDIRKIDWKVYGRLDRFFVKEYEGETNTSVQVILDCSRSMEFASRGITKLAYGQFLAASLVYFAFKQRDGVGFVSFDETVREYVPPRGSIGHLNNVLHAIERTEAGARSNFTRPLVQVAERLRRKGIVIVISDLHGEAAGVLESLRQLAYRGNDVIVFQVLDPEELQFNYEASAQFVDLESRMEMHVVPDFVREEYRKIIRSQVDYFEKECCRDRIDYALIETSKPLDHALFAYLLRREQLY
jgi:uncharacterized protein (DUF58 family)